MDRDQNQERDPDQDRMWAATRLTEAAVTQLFQGASTPIDASRGQQIGQIVAELYSAIYTGKDVQSTLDARPSLAERMAIAPARSRVLPRPTRVGQSGPTPRSLTGSAAPAVGKDAESVADRANLPRSIQNESVQEAPRSQARVRPSDGLDRTVTPASVPEIGPSLGTMPETTQDSLQSLLSEIGADAPREEAEEERMLPPESPVYPAQLQPESLESQLASIASQGPMEPEIPPSAPPPTFATTPLPNSISPRSLAGNLDSPQSVVFITSIIDEIAGVST